MAEVQRFDHDFFRNLIRAAFHHHNAIFHSGDGQIEPAVFQFGVGWIEIVTAVDKSDAHCSDGMRKWNIRCIQSRRCANDGMHRRIDVRVSRQHQRDHLRFIFIAFRKQRPDRPVNHSAVQDFTFGRFTFPFEKSTWNFAGCVKVFTVINREREEIQSFSWLCRARGHQHDGISVADECGSLRLFGQLSNFDRQLPLSDHRADFVNIHVFNSSLIFGEKQKRPENRCPGRSSFSNLSIFVMLRRAAAATFGFRALKSLRDSGRRYRS